MKKICLMIPTQNRDEAIDYYLDNKLLIFSQKNIDVVICDSSNNELTKRCVERFWEKGFNNLYYSFYANDGSDLLGGNKLYHALNEYKEKYEYIWLSGDTTVIDIERIYDDVESGIMQECDFIHIYRNSYGKQTQYISDCNVFFRYFAWSMTHCCSYILSKKMVECVLNFASNLGKIDISFMFVDAIYEYIAFHQFKALYIKDNLFQVSPYRTKSTVHTQKRILEVWAKHWCDEIDALPAVYDNNKDFVKKSLSNNIGLFSCRDTGICERLPVH